MKILPPLRINRRLAATLAAAMVAVAVVAGVVAISQDDDGTGADRRADRIRPAEDGRDLAAPGGPSNPPGAPSSPPSSPPSAPAGPDTAGPAAGSTSPPTQDVDPASPPVTGPPGAQGAVRREPCTATGPPVQPQPTSDGSTGAGGSWVTVARVDGNCGGASGGFTTRGVDTRLLYRSDAEQFLVFVDDLTDTDAAAGYADVECRSRCADEQLLTIGAGRYRIRVEGTDGPWEVVLQEYR